MSGRSSAGLLGDLVRESEGALEPSPRVISYDTATVRDSIVSLAERAPEFDVACVGHGTPLATGGSDALRTLVGTL